MKPIAGFILLAILISVVCATVTVRKASVAVERRKHLAGPPEEFAGHILPTPSDQHQRSEGAYIPAFLAQGKYGSAQGSRLLWTREVPVDSTTLFTCTVFSPVPGLEVRFKLPGMPRGVSGHSEFVRGEGASINGGNKFVSDSMGADLLPADSIVKETSFGFSDIDLPSTTYVFNNPPVGMWTIEVSADAMKAEAFLNDAKPEAILLLDNDAQYEIYTYLHSYSFQQGETIGINALVAPRGFGVTAAVPVCLLFWFGLVWNQ
jgi:hypothetical protein